MKKKKSAMLPEQLKQAREMLQLTQEELGEELGKTGRTITSYESNLQKIDKTIKYAVCWLLLPQRVRDKYTPKFLR